LKIALRSPFLCIPVSLYQGFSLSMYQRINVRHSKRLLTKELRVFVAKDSALARVESKAAKPTQRRGGGNVAPQWHEQVSGRALASEPGRLSQLRKTWAAREL
jgi:hypothetical protein